jgi:TRAP-type C4-dicarboxylate transport system permease small subunit
LVTALVFTFGQPGVQALALTLLSILYAVAHCFVAPMRCPMSQTLQTTLLLCLAAVVLSGTPQAAADAVERATSAYVASASDLLARRLQRWLGLVVPCLAVCAAFVWPAAVRWWAARGKAPSSVRAL